MQIQLIRNATMRISYGGQLILTDPFLAERHSLPSFAGVSMNPLVDLPMPPTDVTAGIGMILVSHLHTDHFDLVAQAHLARDLPIFCQPGDESRIREAGFGNVTAVAETVTWRGMTVTRTPGQHGTGSELDQMGQVSGFVLQAAGEPVTYWAGDTIWYEAVETVIEQHNPALVITHSSGAYWQGKGPIVMDAEQTLALCRKAGEATVVAVHLDSLDHGTVSREALRAAATSAGIQPERLVIPADGQRLEFDEQGGLRT